MFPNGKGSKADSEISTARPELELQQQRSGRVAKALERADKGTEDKNSDTRQSLCFPDPGMSFSVMQLTWTFLSSSRYLSNSKSSRVVPLCYQPAGPE